MSLEFHKTCLFIMKQKAMITTTTLHVTKPPPTKLDHLKSWFVLYKL